jgi:molybdate transport system ATP-binding protein
MGRLECDCRLWYPGGFTLEARFEAGDGVTALFGPSGSGKSTLLALIAGVLRPDAGRIVLSGRTLLDTGAGVFLPPEGRQIGILFQDHLLFPHLSVRDNLRFGHGRARARPMSFNRVVDVLEIGDLLDRRPATLSGGQAQRVALGRALLRGPELLLMDEPLTALDLGLKERILTYLERAVAEWHLPTLFVSHDQADVRRLAEQVVVLEAGRVIAAGATAGTLDRAVLTQLRHHPGPVNLLRVTDLAPVDRHWEGRVGNQRLHLSADGLQAGASVHVQFLAQDVMLAGAEVAGLSARNRLHGTVREILELPGRAHVAVDVGQFLWALITPEAVRELDIRPGKDVTCLIKTSAMAVVPGSRPT